MVKRTLTTLVLLVLLVAGSAQAQNWFGIRTGYPLGVTLHYGIDNGIARGFDLRINGRVFARGGATSIGVGIDALRDVVIEPPVSVYIGAGPAAEFGGGVFLIDLHVLGGAEFRFIDFGLPALGIFVEAAIGADLRLSGGSATIPSFGAALGFNFWF